MTFPDEVLLRSGELQLQDCDMQVYTCSKNLRWLERIVPDDPLLSQRVLQQAWHGDKGGVQWHDVPTVQQECDEKE